MIRKFNELYGGGGDTDRGDWPSSPEVPIVRSDREKISLIRDLFIDLDSEELSSDEFISKIREILSISEREFPGTKI